MPERSAATHHSPANLNEALSELLEDCRCLTRYAVETDQLPSSVDVKQLYNIRRGFDATREISDEDFGTLVSAYETLERRLGPVSANTLRATEDSADGTKSLARRYVDYLFRRTILIISLVLSGHLIHFISPVVIPDKEGAQNLLQIQAALAVDPLMTVIGLVAVFLIPFLYGALGADAFLLRETTHKLHTRQFDPRRIPENRA